MYFLGFFYNKGCLTFNGNKLHFTFQLLSVPLDSGLRERAGATGKGRKVGVAVAVLLDGWGGGGHLGRTGPGNFRCMLQSFPGWEGFGDRVGVSILGGCWMRWVGVWGLGKQPATAGSLCWFHI